MIRSFQAWIAQGMIPSADLSGTYDVPLQFGERNKAFGKWIQTTGETAGCFG